MTPAGPLLLMAQVDDAPGELLGHVIEEMGRMGAKNVQLLSSLGKKGRPGYVLLVDIDAEDEADFAGVLVGELGIWGYRILSSEHKHFEIRRYQTRLELHCAGSVDTFPLRLKRVMHRGEFVRVKAEHADLAAAANQLKSRRLLSLSVLKAAVETAVGSAEPGAVVRVTIDPHPPSEP
jgi:uncharacterized protein (DUF111 family)